MTETSGQRSGGTLSSCHARIAENSSITDSVRPKPNQNPYQVASAPLKLKCTAFIEANTASDAGPRLFCASMPPAVCPTKVTASRVGRDPERGEDTSWPFLVLARRRGNGCAARRGRAPSLRLWLRHDSGRPVNPSWRTVTRVPDGMGSRR